MSLIHGSSSTRRVLLGTITLTFVAASFVGMVSSVAVGAPFYGVGRPDAADTGVPSGVQLRRSGSITVTQDGAVIEGLDVDGTITVKADNVTIRNTRVSAGDPATNTGPITYMGDATRLIFTVSGTRNTLIDHVELDGRGDSRTMGLVGASVTVRNSDIHGTGDGIKLGAQSVYEHNYIHDLSRNGNQHSDGMQLTGGSNIVIRNNTIDWTAGLNSAIMLKADFAPIRNVQVVDNFLSGGQFTLEVIGTKEATNQPGHRDTPYPASDVVVRGNTFDHDYHFGHFMRDGNVSALTWESNVWQDGRSVGPNDHEAPIDDGGPGPAAQSSPSPSPSPTDSPSPSQSPKAPDASPIPSPTPSRPGDGATESEAASPSPSPSPNPAPSPSPVVTRPRPVGPSRTYPERAPGDIRPAGPEAPPSGGNSSGAGSVVRLAGPNRVLTAAKLSEAAYKQSWGVVIARADAYADALAAAPLAAQRGMPLLLTFPDRLDDSVVREVRRVGATKALIVGGPSAVSPQVERQLRGLGLDVRRIAGSDRFDTARAVASVMPATDEVFVAQGVSDNPSQGWPDALSASALASASSAPLLLVPTDGVPAPTLQELKRHKTATIVGGTRAVSPATERAIGARVGKVSRIAGRDRYETSVAVAQTMSQRGLDSDTLVLASGDNWPDGLVAGAAAGKKHALFLLVPGERPEVSPATFDWMKARAPKTKHVVLVGGDKAINRNSERHVRRAMNN